jgi:hypothetical protein
MWRHVDIDARAVANEPTAMLFEFLSQFRQAIEEVRTAKSQILEGGVLKSENPRRLVRADQGR